MSHRTAASTCLVAAALVACGRLDLGSYANVGPQGSNGSSVLPPVAAAGGQADEGGGGAGGEPSVAGQAPRGEGGAESGGQPATGGAGGADEPPRARKSSCDSLDPCGVAPTQSCCAVERVPAGWLVRGGLTAGEPPPAASHVSEFYLGTFEVTVGRFQAFLEDYDDWRASGAPRVGDGAHPRVPGSGWRAEWLRRADGAPDSHGLGATRRIVEDEWRRCSNIPLFNSIVSQPANCVSFYEAQAFCVWDGGRLPTDLEWERAAAGGEESRPYPWGAEEPTGDLAMFGCSSNIGKPYISPPVGYFEKGKGRFNQLELAGSLSEWTLDTVGDPFPVPCDDCANVAQIYEQNPRSTRGGNWSSDASSLRVTASAFMEAYLHLPMHGIRCAYDVPPPQP